MDRKKHIAFYISSLNKGGAERVFVNLAEYFLREGYCVTIVTQCIGEHEYTYSPAVSREISDISGKEISGSRFVNLYRRIRKLRCIWKRIKPDVILSCNGKNNFMAVTTALGLGAKAVVSVVGEPKEEYGSKVMRLLAELLFRRAAGIILQTAESKLFFSKRIRRKAVILQNSLNPLFMRERYEGVRDKVIVSVGRLDANKNHEMIIRSFALITDKFPEYRLVIYGEGESRKRLEAVIGELGLGERVSLPGVTGDVAGAIYKAAVFVLSSYSEGMPNALIEAMALGLPVISTDCPCGGPKELMGSGENGLLIPAGDGLALREALERLLENPGLGERMGKNAAKIQDMLNPERTNGIWREFIESL